MDGALIHAAAILASFLLLWTLIADVPAKPIAKTVVLTTEIKAGNVSRKRDHCGPGRFAL